MRSLVSNPCCRYCGSTVKLWYVRDPDTGFCFYLCDECLNNEVLV